MSGYNRHAAADSIKDIDTKRLLLLPKRSDQNSMSEARCPLGFTGTLPAGHPVMPGMKASSSSPSWSSALTSYRPSTLLVVDAVFLGLCIIAAIYRDDIKALLAKSPTPAATSK